jgi:hypothetical protein
VETVVLWRVLPVLGALVALSGVQQSRGREVWVEDTFEDFRDGEFEASGADLYVTRAGSIKTVQRFDLNNDGYIDSCLEDRKEEYFNI